MPRRLYERLTEARTAVAPDVARVVEVFKKYKDWLISLKGVITAYPDLEHGCIVVEVWEGYEHYVPRTLDGIPVRLVVRKYTPSIPLATV